MSLRQRILEVLKSTSQQMSMRELYTKFPDIAQTTIRGRVYENVGKGITKLDKGLYISSEAIVQHGDTMQIVDDMISQGDLFDFIFNKKILCRLPSLRIREYNLHHHSTAFGRN